tara:strand:+ start:5347 stop:5457 length:111 start_codon:yes stop_codon:yes gene_type:complete
MYALTEAENRMRLGLTEHLSTIENKYDHADKEETAS